jgi:hypothetical protein
MKNENILYFFRLELVSRLDNFCSQKFVCVGLAVPFFLCIDGGTFLGIGERVRSLCVALG